MKIHTNDIKETKIEKQSLHHPKRTPQDQRFNSHQTQICQGMHDKKMKFQLISHLLWH